MNDIDWLSLSLFLIILIIICTLLIINQKENNLENFDNHKIPFSIMYKSRPNDMIWEIKNNKIDNKYLNVIRLRPFYVREKDFFYRPVGQYINITEEPLMDLNDIKDKISLNLCSNKKLQENMDPFIKIWDTNNLDRTNNPDTEPFSIYKIYGENSISCIIKSGIDNKPDNEDYAIIPREFINEIIVNKKDNICSLTKGLFLNKTNEYVSLTSNFESEKKKILINDFYEKHINNKKDKITKIILDIEPHI